MQNINNSLFLFIAIAGLSSAQPMSLNEPQEPHLGCNFLSCSGSILGAVETCLNTGSAEEILNCIENILNSIGQGDCLACICDVIPQMCQKNETMDGQLILNAIENTSAYVKAKSEVKLDDASEIDPEMNCNFFSCAGSILGAVETCIHTGSAEEVIECVKNILDSIGQGECQSCICDIIPDLCQEKKIDTANH